MSDYITDIYVCIYIGDEEYKEKRRFLYGESMGGAVALLLHKKDPPFWHGALLVAPMCKVINLHYYYYYYYYLIIVKTKCLFELWSFFLDIREGKATPRSYQHTDQRGRDYTQMEDRPHKGRHRLCVQGPDQARRGENW